MQSKIQTYLSISKCFIDKNELEISVSDSFVYVKIKRKETQQKGVPIVADCSGSNVSSVNLNSKLEKKSYIYYSY